MKQPSVQSIVYTVQVGSRRGEAEEAGGRLERQAKLIEQLEEHVEQLQAISTPYRSALYTAYCTVYSIQWT